MRSQSVSSSARTATRCAPPNAPVGAGLASSPGTTTPTIATGRRLDHDRTQSAQGWRGSSRGAGCVRKRPDQTLHDVWTVEGADGVSQFPNGTVLILRGLSPGLRSSLSHAAGTRRAYSTQTRPSRRSKGMDGFTEGDAVYRLRPSFPSVGHALGPSPWLRKVGLHWQHGWKSAPYTRARRAEEVRTCVRELPRSAHH